MRRLAALTRQKGQAEVNPCPASQPQFSFDFSSLLLRPKSLWPFGVRLFGGRVE